MRTEQFIVTMDLANHELSAEDISNRLQEVILTDMEDDHEIAAEEIKVTTY